jgi:hypothetical protein
LDAVATRCQASGAYVVAGYTTVIVPDGGRCRINGGLIDPKSGCVGVVGYSGAILNFRGLASGRTALTLKPSS